MSFDTDYFETLCYPFQGNYVKDLTCLGRDLRKTIIIDNSPYSYMFHPQNALPVSSFIDDPADDALFDMLPHLYQLAESEDVTDVVPKRRVHASLSILPHAHGQSARVR